jgi:hypothetical protein
MRLAAVLLSALVLARSTHGDPKPDADRVALVRSLENAAKRWAGQRTSLVGSCSTCGGKGYYAVMRAGPGGGFVREPCYRCDEKGWTLNASAYRALEWDMRSPAFRAVPGQEARMDGEFRRARAAPLCPDKYTSYTLVESALADREHGTVTLRFMPGKVPWETRWIRAEEPVGKLGWFLYDESIDPPWPEPPPEAHVPPPPPPPPPPLAPLAPEKEKLVFQTVAGLANPAFKLEAASMRGTWLVLTLSPLPGERGAQPETRAGSSAVAVARALLPLPEAWHGLTCVWKTLWRDAAGRAELRPAFTSHLSREKFKRVDWAGLTDKEQVALFDWESHGNAGWIPWDDAEDRVR